MPSLTLHNSKNSTRPAGELLAKMTASSKSAANNPLARKGYRTSKTLVQGPSGASDYDSNTLHQHTLKVTASLGEPYLWETTTAKLGSCAQGTQPLSYTVPAHATGCGISNIKGSATAVELVAEDRLTVVCSLFVARHRSTYTPGRATYDKNSRVPVLFAIRTRPIECPRAVPVPVALSSSQ